MKRVLIWTAVIMMAMTGAALAGTDGGDKEIQVQGSVSTLTNSEDDTRISISTVQVIFNYFFTSNISIGGTWRGSASYMEPDPDYNRDDTISTKNFFLVRGDFYLGSATSKLMPYVGAQIGQIYYTDESGGEKNSDSTGTYGFHGGLKIFAGENTSWNLEFDRTIYSEDQDNGDTLELYIDSFFAGFSYYF